MYTHALTTAMTLYRSGTLSLAQAAARAGRSEAELIAALKKYGIPVRDDADTAVTASADAPLRAD